MMTENITTEEASEAAKYAVGGRFRTFKHSTKEPIRAGRTDIFVTVAVALLFLAAVVCVFIFD